jgi:hypothetical protein
MKELQKNYWLLTKIIFTHFRREKEIKVDQNVFGLFLFHKTTQEILRDNFCYYF